MEAVKTKPSFWKKLGIIGFMFFLLKGLAWLVFIAWCAWQAGN